MKKTTKINLNFYQLFEKTCATTQNNVKSHVFWILKKNVKNVKASVQFQKPLNHCGL